MRLRRARRGMHRAEHHRRHLQAGGDRAGSANQAGVTGGSPMGSPERSESASCDWESPRLVGRHRLAARATFVPFDDEAAATVGERGRPSRFQILNGRWRFHYAQAPCAAPADFMRPEFDDSRWDDITVPGHWQLQGYGRSHVRNGHPNANAGEEDRLWLTRSSCT